MVMLGKKITSLLELKQNLSNEELLYSYYSGELESFLLSIGETEKCLKMSQLKRNGYILAELYKLLDLSPDDTEEAIRVEYQ